MKTSRLYPVVFDAIKDPLILVDQNGVVILANASALSFFSFGDSHSIGSITCTDIEYVFDAGEIATLMKQYDSIRDYTLSNREGRGSGVTLDIDCVYVEDGKPSFKLLHFHTGSAEKRGELWRDELISMVSHEIKNPLSAMKNSVEILLSQSPGALTDGQRHFLDTSGRSIDRLTHLLDGFLDVSRISAGAFELNRSDTDVRQFITEVIESFTTLFNAKRVHLDWEVKEGVSTGYLDSGKLEQVIINLLSNALKFTPEKGDISVTAGPAGVEKVSEELRLLPWDTLGDPRLLEFVVEDTGLGMSNETLDNLFNRYHRTGDAGHGRGAHLGLSISKALVEAQDGQLDIVSQLGIGTKVTALIPQDKHTACVLSRMRRASDLVTSSLGARRRVSIFALGKLDEEDWEDIFNSWRKIPVVNPPRESTSVNPFHVWTIDRETAYAVFVELGDGEQPGPANFFGPQFEKCGEGAYLSSGCALGVCSSPDDLRPGRNSSFVQLCNIATCRMKTARKELVQSAADNLASAIESVVVDLGS